MNDWSLRQALLRGPLAPSALDPADRVLQEVVLSQGRVVDLLLVSKGRMEAWELKGEGDSLTRLAAQAEAYQACCHRMHLLCHPKHLAQAQKQLPSWWGLWVCDEGGLKAIRKAGPNPQHNPWALVDLLGVKELREVLCKFGENTACRKAVRRSLLQFWRSQFGPETAQALALDRLRARIDWGQAKPQPGRGRRGGILREVLWRGPTHLAPHPRTGKFERRRIEALECGHELLVALIPFAKKALRRRCPQCRDEAQAHAQEPGTFSHQEGAVALDDSPLL